MIQADAAGGFQGGLTSLLQDHPEQAGLVIGLLVFAESLAFVGFFVPSTPMLLAIGAMLGAGLLEPGPLLLYAILGAVLGDAVSYELGRWMGPSALRHRMLKRRRRAIARARLFIRKAGMLTMVIGRFTGPIRSLVPLAAGMLKMRRTQFQIANLIGAVLWIPVMLAPGYLAAQGLSLLPEGMLEPVLAGLAIAAMGLLFWKWRKRRATSG
ncbi:DedA family protein [Phenylobacterium sp.]|uniref:DedA family protein n=1 Tax=Phenylobacterium sp. TaxID=1871053 RepID=UPI0027316515|nr:DedA family protein [Phenylobacterium sp.]MDP1616469.1 DedA family protein [Phenylobacterium sp.]MDP1988016.1 DedA family protein [Phenylobacterium sp.]